MGAIVMMESRISIRRRGTIKVSSAAGSQRRDTGCCRRCNSDDAGGAVTQGKRAGWDGQRNATRTDGTNRPTTNQAKALDQQRPKQGKRLAPGHHIPAAKLQRHHNHGSGCEKQKNNFRNMGIHNRNAGHLKQKKTTQELWTSITATAAGMAKRMYKNTALYV